MFRQRHAGIVAGLDDHPLEQLPYRYLGVDLYEHPGALGTPCLFADVYLVVQPDVAVFQFVEHHVGGHDLGETGRIHALIGVLAHQKLPAVEVHQHIALGRQLGWRRHERFGLGEHPCGPEQEEKRDAARQEVDECLHVVLDVPR